MRAIMLQYLEKVSKATLPGGQVRGYRQLQTSRRVWEPSFHGPLCCQGSNNVDCGGELFEMWGADPAPLLARAGVAVLNRAHAPLFLLWLWLSFSGLGLETLLGQHY